MRRLAIATLAFAAAAPAQVDRAACERAIARLDAAFAVGDAAAYLATFAWESPALQAACAERLRALFSSKHRLQRRSSIEGEVRMVGPRQVALVRQEFRRSESQAKADAVELVYLAFRAGNDARPVLQIEVAASVRDHVHGERFGCPPCNYEIGGADGWLCVPLRAEVADVLEAVTFLYLGTDLVCDVSVHVDDAPTDAAAAAAVMARALRTALPAAVAEPVQPWQPPCLQAPLPLLFTGAVQRIALPDTTSTDIHVVCLGRLRHVLTVRGDRSLIAAQQPALQALLASFRLLSCDADAAALAAWPIAAHHGGKLGDADYVNDRWHLAFTWPTGWIPMLKAGGAAFQAVFQAPAGAGRLWLTGYAAPPGLAEWRPAEADRWLADLCQRAGLRLLPGQDSGWGEAADADGFAVRHVVARALAPAGDDAPDRHIRLALRRELLVVLDGFVRSGEPDLLLAAFASLRAH
jgi:hypothetical protein